jgi:hypothetical protein
LLRQAALILADGWSHNANARDDTGRIVPLFSGVGRAAINPEAMKFSPYGAICKAASQCPGRGWSHNANARDHTPWGTMGISTTAKRGAG